MLKKWQHGDVIHSAVPITLSLALTPTHTYVNTCTEFFLVAGTAILHLSQSPFLLPLTFSSSLLLLLFLFSLAQSLLCQHLLYLFWSLCWIIIVSVLSFLTFIAMRLGISSFISDILSTSSNICFCWTEGKVELNLLSPCCSSHCCYYCCAL